MFYTREQIIRKLADRCGYYQRDVRTLLIAFDDVVEELLGEATDEEDVVVQVVRGLRAVNTIIPERNRVNPKDLSPVVCPPRSKLSIRISETIRENLNNKYEESKRRN